MKIAVLSDLSLIPLKHRLVMEGNEIVSDLTQADLVLSDQRVSVVQAAMKSGEVFPSSSIQALGYSTTPDRGDFFLSRWYGGTQGWSAQTYLGIPVTGLGDGGMSASTSVGCCGLYTQSSAASALFERTEIVELLEELEHSGFVSLIVSSEDGRVSGMETGLPSWGLYGMLEGVPGSLGDFLRDGASTRLLESWTVAVAVTRYPFPSVLSTKDSAQVVGLSPEVEKHFWIGEHSRFRNAVHTRSTLIGVASAWSTTALSDAVNRAVSTCRHLGVSEIQYRTDLVQVASPTLERCRRLGILE